MVKVVIFDVDGVIINRDRYFSEKLAEKLQLDAKKDVLPFFTGVFKECMTGKKDLRDEVLPWLVKWGWVGNVDQFLEYWFTEESNIDNQLMALAENLKSTGVKLFLGTDNEKRRVNYIMNNLELKNTFEKAFSSSTIGFKKDSPQFFQYVLTELGEFKPEEILFIDDDEHNVGVAREAGITAIFYEGFEKLIESLNEYSELKFQ